MKNFYFLTFSLLFFFTLNACKSAGVQNPELKRDVKIQSILYFNPEVFPDIDEIKEPTYAAFYSAVSDKISQSKDFKMLRVDSEMSFDSSDSSTIKEFCQNNGAQFAIVPKVKYFKVGFGKYIFSNQVIVSMKLYDSSGEFITETNYDTFKKNARILGSAENSIKIGTVGAMNNMAKILNRPKNNLVKLP